jgi:hypothetical protein
VLVLENGMKFHEVGVTNKDAQFLELRKFQITDIARMFRVPPHMIADLDRATFSNIEQQSLEFVMHTMTPWAERWEASIESDLMLEGDRLEVEFDFANLMRGDAASRSAYYQSGIQNGWLTRNEARISENLNPLQGLDQPLRPLNMVEEEDAEEAEQENETNDTEPSEDATPPAEQDMSLRFRMLVASNANRLARRIAKKGAIGTNEIGLISQAFGLDATHVSAWAQQQVLPLQEDALSASLIQLGMNQ